MANLKEVRDRIKSVISTQQITKAMKMVAAAKLRRAQQAIVQMRPYSVKLNEILSNILSNSSGDAATEFGAERPVKNALIVVVTSNRGLCGAFNSNVIKNTVALINGKYNEQYKSGNLSMLFVGKKAYDYFRKRYEGINFIADHVEVIGKDFSFEQSAPIAEGIMDQFAKAQYDAVDIVYAQFKNAAVQNFKVEQFLPVAKLEAEEGEDSGMLADFIYEPDKESILTNLVPTILKTQFHKCLLDSNASENGARMTAMDKASENADELLKELRINYNKARQEAITSELSEIVGGAAALESD